MNEQKPQIDFLINRRYADYRHGTGVQIKLFSDQLSGKPLHICWDAERSVNDSYQPVCNLNTSLLRIWPFRRGRGLVARMEEKFGLKWDNPARLAKQVRRVAGAKAGKAHAYVIIASEEEAAIARQVLDVLGAEYVVNVMDYLHWGATELAELPNFAAVVNRARKVFALTPPIQKVLGEISGRQDIQILGVARDPAPGRSTAVSPQAKTFEIVMMGSVDYTRGLRELHKFCEGLKRTGVSYCLNYLGTQEMRDRLGTELPVNYRGVRLGRERDEILNSMHLAYLPGPDGDPVEDYLARFSFPSRLTDYFWHGLPVVGPLFDDSATAQMVCELRGKGVWFSRESQPLVEVVQKLAKNLQEWKAASEAVYGFAKRNFAMNRSASAILDSFNT